MLNELHAKLVNNYKDDDYWWNGGCGDLAFAIAKPLAAEGIYWSLVLIYDENEEAETADGFHFYIELEDGRCIDSHGIQDEDVFLDRWDMWDKDRYYYGEIPICDETWFEIVNTAHKVQFSGSVVVE